MCEDYLWCGFWYASPQLVISVDNGGDEVFEMRRRDGRFWAIGDEIDASISSKSGGHRNDTGQILLTKPQTKTL